MILFRLEILDPLGLLYHCQSKSTYPAVTLHLMPRSEFDPKTSLKEPHARAVLEDQHSSPQDWRQSLYYLNR